MYEKEIDRLNKLTLIRTIGSAERISLKEVLAAEIPLPLRNMIRVDVEQKLQDELRNNFVNSRFDFSHPEVISLQNRMNSILVLNYSFNRHEYLELVHDAIHLLLNYLMRPQWTLRSFLFDNTTQVSSDVILKALRNFSVYEYLKDLIVRIIKEKNIKLMTINEFQSLIWKCDREYIRRKDGYQLAQITLAIYDFINYGNRETKSTVPTKGLIKLFDDKGMRKVVDRLQIELQRHVNEISFDELCILLEDLRKTYDGFEFENTLQKIPVEIPVTAPLEDSPVVTITIDESEVVEKNDSISPQLSTKSQLLPLENFFDDDERKRFVKKIFRKNEKDFSDAVTDINNMTSWKEASKYVDEIYILNEVDLYSPEATRFTEITYNRFFTRKGK
ncbi:MAG: hypothetical protein QME58_08680 [Bacteroidota bacterium]|nr:hypothetical protein [Bacteroidota bacterium]